MSKSQNGSCSLSPEQIQFYNENGYLVLRKMFDQNTLDMLKNRFVSICNEDVQFPKVYMVTDKDLVNKTNEKERYVNKLNSIGFDKVFSAFSEHPNLLDVVEQLIGEDIVFIDSIFINKPPGTKRHPPHQDLLYMPIELTNDFLNVWVALDPSTLQSGCLFVVPGSHKSEILYPEVQAPDTEKLFLELEDVDNLAPVEERVDLEMEPGDIVIVNGFLIHGSKPNISQNYRKSVSTFYATSKCVFKNYVDVKGQEHLNGLYVAAVKKYNKIPDNEVLDFFKAKAKQLRGSKANGQGQK